jgi:hypothetical protein
LCTTSICVAGQCVNTPKECIPGPCQIFDSCNSATGECKFIDNVPCCGNGECELGETGETCGNSCPGDCTSGMVGGAVCGNNVCEDGENCNTCSQDCNGVTGGKPSSRYCCVGGSSSDCGDSRCTLNGKTCNSASPSIPFCCGDSVCNSATENAQNCLADCGGLTLAPVPTTPAPTPAPDTPAPTPAPVTTAPVITLTCVVAGQRGTDGTCTSSTRCCSGTGNCSGGNPNNRRCL